MGDAGEENEVEYNVTYLDGEKETTNFVKRAGRARTVYANGDVFEGIYDAKGRRHGKGSYIWNLSVRCNSRFASVSNINLSTFAHNLGLVPLVRPSKSTRRSPLRPR